MMKLSTLWKLDQTFSHDRTSPIADAIASRWKHDPGSIRFYRSSANHIVTLTIDGERTFLRFAAASERRLDTIKNELAIIEHVRQRGVDAVRPVASLNGRFVESVETPIGTYHAVLFAGIPGQHKDPDTIAPAEAFAWGATAGRLHNDLASVPSQYNLKPPAWTTMIEAAKAASPGVRQEAIRLERVLDGLPRDASTYGLLHNDLELDNLIWNRAVPTVLDFDEYSDGWYLHDIAKALDEILVDSKISGDERGQAFLAGYRSERALDDSMLTWLPDFAALTQLHGWYMRMQSLDLAAEDVDQPWMVSLITDFSNWCQEFEAELATRATPVE
jgi:Ser/Thr protein kinase RdoA (MazF antagonist)